MGAYCSKDLATVIKQIKSSQGFPHCKAITPIRPYDRRHRPRETQGESTFVVYSCSTALPDLLNRTRGPPI